MAGYHNYSMSNNALSAYASGEMPLSKWTKSAMLSCFQNAETRKILSKNFTVAGLRKILLERSSWHHTSCKYNKTYFYSFVAREDLEPENALAFIEDLKSYPERLKAYEEAYSKERHNVPVIYNGEKYSVNVSEFGKVWTDDSQLEKTIIADKLSEFPKEFVQAMEEEHGETILEAGGIVAVKHYESYSEPPIVTRLSKEDSKRFRDYDLTDYAGKYFSGNLHGIFRESKLMESVEFIGKEDLPFLPVYPEIGLY